MKPIPFKEQNVVFAKDQKEYTPLPAFKMNNPEGEVISCWSLSFSERLRIIFTGKIWMSLWTFNQPLTPSRLTTDKREVLRAQRQWKKWECKFMSILNFKLWFCDCHYKAPFGRVTMGGCKKHD